MVWNLKVNIIDIETAFLSSELKQSIFMEIPSGMEVVNSKCLVLKKTIYVLIQSARQFHVKHVKALKSCGFTGSLLDPCLWIKNSNSGMSMMAIFLENRQTTESKEGIKEFLQDLKRHDFGLKIEDDLYECLSCQIKVY
jgi:hypothetical protein